MKRHRILLVDDNEDILTAFRAGLEGRGFEVVPAATVNKALRFIASEHFDVLLSDLHLPDAGDGLTVVSAMRKAHPEALTLMQNGHSAMREALSVIRSLADQVPAKPIDWVRIAEIIQKKLSNPKLRTVMNKERVAAILERDTEVTIQDWLCHVESSQELTAVPLRPRERTGHLLLLLGDIVDRLRLRSAAKALASHSAREHGILRRMQGYSVPMLVDESRMLQASILRTLHSNLGNVDSSTVLLDVMAIADEVDSQLKQAVLGFMAPLPAKTANIPGSWLMASYSATRRRESIPIYDREERRNPERSAR